MSDKINHFYVLILDIEEEFNGQNILQKEI